METSYKVFHWIPRVICIMAILFISMFALDAFEPGHSIWQQIGAFIMHLLPSFVLLGILIVAWKWEFIAGLIFMAIGLGLSPFIYHHNFNMNHSIGKSLFIVLIINIPFVVVGILFVISHFLKKKNLLKTHNQ